MTFQVLVENKGYQNYTATVLGWPDCTAQGTTRQEALDRVRRAMRERLTHSDIVPMEIAVEPSASRHPWLKYAGMFQDHPLFDEIQAHIEQYRLEIDDANDVP